MNDGENINTGPLQGIKVLEISQWIAGPAAGAILADFGADVIKVEHPVRGDAWRANIKTSPHHRKDINFQFEQDNRNKRGITLDLSKEEGQKVVHRLIGHCDILLTNLRPYELKRYDLEYQALAEIYPRLIWSNVTGYGLTGPDCELAGYDFTAFWAKAGFQALIREPGRPPVFSRTAAGDHLTSLSLFGGIMPALYMRDRTGKGQEVKTSLYGTGIWSLANDIMGALAIGAFIPPEKREDKSAMVNTYLAKDGKWIMMLSMVTPDPYWSPLCAALDLPHLEKDERFSSFQPRKDHNAELRAIMEETIAKKTRKEWEAIFKEHALIYAAIQDPLDIIDDPQAWATGRFLSAEHPVYGPFHWVNNPIEMGEAPTSIQKPAPEFNQHTEEVFLEAGFSWEEITLLKEQGVIT